MAKKSQQLELIKKPASSSSSSSEETTSEQLKKRESQELVIAFSGAVGCGVKKSVEIAKEVLFSEGYAVKVGTNKLSKLNAVLKAAK